MKHIIMVLLALCCTFNLSAQSLKVTKSQSATDALERIEQVKQPQTAMGYRIGIFFDNGQDARNKANETKELFTASFPQEPVYVVYESPYYKVSAGNCLTEEEAIMLFERVRTVFPNAYVMRENMKVSDFIEQERKVILPDSLSSEAPMPQSTQRL